MVAAGSQYAPWTATRRDDAVRLRRMLALAAVGISLAGCSSTASPSTTSSSSPASTTSTTSTTVTSTTAAPTTSTTTSTTAAPTTTTLPTEDLPLTKSVIAQLLRAGAALNGLKASDYTGLAAGSTYYAYDSTTMTYWAGAALVPSPKSQRAQVSVQDDGSYLLFIRPAGKAWTADDVGLAGIGATKCPAVVPTAILALFHWAAGTCRPSG